MDAVEDFFAWTRRLHWPTEESLLLFSVIFSIFFLARNALRSPEERFGLVVSVVLGALCSFYGAKLVRDFSFVTAIGAGLLAFGSSTLVFFSRATRKEIYYWGALLLPFVVALIHLGSPTTKPQFLHAAIALIIGLLSVALYKHRPVRGFIALIQERSSPLAFFVFCYPLARVFADGTWAQLRLEHALAVCLGLAIATYGLLHKKPQVFLIKT